LPLSRKGLRPLLRSTFTLGAALLLLTTTGKAAQGCSEPGHPGDVPSLDRIPLDPPSYVISSGFGCRYGVLHTGIDLVCPRRRPIVAAAAGFVRAAGWMGRYGWAVRVRHPDDIETLYAHMEEEPAVTVGQDVQAGTQLGIVGSSGLSTGPHLHFETLKGGRAYDPEYSLPFTERNAWKPIFPAYAVTRESPPMSGSRVAAFDVGKESQVILAQDGALFERDLPLVPWRRSSTVEGAADVTLSGSELFVRREDGVVLRRSHEAWLFQHLPQPAAEVRAGKHGAIHVRGVRGRVWTIHRSKLQSVELPAKAAKLSLGFGRLAAILEDGRVALPRPAPLQCEVLEVPGGAREVALAFGDLYVVSRRGRIYQRDGDTLRPQAGPASTVHLVASAEGLAALDQAGDLWVRRPRRTEWVRIPAPTPLASLRMQGDHVLARARDDRLFFLHASDILDLGDPGPVTRP
jgi:hypothetical protein